MSENEIERAVSAWIEVREDGVPLLCWDTNRGETKAVELSPEAAGQLRREFIQGPSVRNDRSVDTDSDRSEVDR